MYGEGWRVGSALFLAVYSSARLEKLSGLVYALTEGINNLFSMMV